MPVLGAALLSLFGAFVAFFSTLAILDGTFFSPFPSAPDSRIGSFAAPGLSINGPANLATLRPIPVSIVRDAGASGAAAEPAAETHAAPRKSALVAPLVRRTPPTPVLASDETPPVTQLGAIAKAPEPPQPRIPTRKLIAPELRSALGGPRPASPGRATPTAAKPRPSIAPAREPATQGRGP